MRGRDKEREKKWDECSDLKERLTWESERMGEREKSIAEKVCNDPDLAGFSLFPISSGFPPFEESQWLLNPRASHCN